jgi:hypothetical protein
LADGLAFFLETEIGVAVIRGPLVPLPPVSRSLNVGTADLVALVKKTSNQVAANESRAARY